jgi:hypothetical protein
MSPQQPKSIDEKLNDIMTVLTGGHDSNGVFYPGLSPRVQAVERRVDALEREKSLSNESRLTLARGIGIAAFGGAITQSIAWLKDHLPK